MEAQAQIESLLKKINDSFLSGDPQTIGPALDPIFHKDIVIRGPDFTIVAEGKNACIKSYVDFATAAKIQSFQMKPAQIDLYGDMAIASYGWTIRYILDGKEHSDAGTDVFMFVLEDGRWLAAWRALSQDP